MRELVLPARVNHFLCGVATEIEARIGAKVSPAQILEALVIDRVAEMRAWVETTDGKCETTMLRVGQNEQGDNVLILGEALYMALLEQHRSILREG